MLSLKNLKSLQLAVLHLSLPLIQWTTAVVIGKGQKTHKIGVREATDLAPISYCTTVLCVWGLLLLRREGITEP